MRVSKVCFAYRKNKDEYRVQVNEENREKLRSMHSSGFWSIIFGFLRNQILSLHGTINFYSVLEQRIDLCTLEKVYFLK